MSRNQYIEVSGLKDVQAGITSLLKGLQGNAYAKVGVLSGKASRDDGAITNTEIAVKHEFGSMSEKIPARSFLRMPIEFKSEEIFKRLSDIKKSEIKRLSGKTIINKNSEIPKSLLVNLVTKLGLLAEEAIQGAFDTGGFGQWRQLSPITVFLRKRGKNGKPSTSILVDTAQLRRSVTSVVISGE